MCTTESAGLAARLRAAREMAGISAVGLSKLAGIAGSHVGLIEGSQRSNPTASTLMAVADVLGVSVDWLLYGREPEPTPEHVCASVDRARARSEAA